MPTFTLILTGSPGPRPGQPGYKSLSLQDRVTLHSTTPGQGTLSFWGPFLKPRRPHEHPTSQKKKLRHTETSDSW